MSHSQYQPLLQRAPALCSVLVDAVADPVEHSLGVVAVVAMKPANPPVLRCLGAPISRVAVGLVLRMKAVVLVAVVADLVSTWIVAWTCSGFAAAAAAVLEIPCSEWASLLAREWGPFPL